MRSFNLLTLSTLALVCATFACGGESTPEPASSTPAAAADSGPAPVDACALVTQAEADKILGAPAKQDRPAEANHPPHLVACRYTAERGRGLAVLSLLVRTGYSDTEAKTTFEETRKLDTTQPVSGLADEAFWLADQLWVRKGLHSLTFSGNIERGAAEELAKQAVARLP